MIAIDLSKQQALDADLRAIQQINFTGNLGRNGNTTMFFITEEAKETVLEFLKRKRKSFVNTILLILILLNVISLNTKYSLIFISIK